VERNNKIDTSNNTDDWKHFKITRTIPEQHTGKARNQGTTENGHIVHCTHIAESADAKAQNIQHG